MSDVSRVEEVFLEAVEKSDPVQRAMYLDAACGDDEDFRRRVETLLAAQPQVGQFLESPVDLEPTGVYQDRGSKPESTASIGDRVGPYKLLERIGEGGMGEVWVADQQEPIKRRVALKLIKPGMDSRSVLGRFEAERQALAVMDHPNIAKVLDAGTTKDGRPYFVMELVKGTPITEFADARQLTPQQRLEMFVPVCQAIQHAHMKGIIHRDIKPSNVLVALHDEMPVPKVIDFGVAKAVGQQLTEKTIYTGFGALVGTPAYMAPEQATFNQLDIDTRADVYALGVLLYELLAGSPPIESERLKKAALDEVLRIVRDEEPPRPSQRLSTSHSKASIAATRGSEPLKLSQLMRGELDWIVMKALEKDRTRRYESANGFAADIQRYLTGEQVQAVPPSLGYRLRKAYRRNKAAVWVASAFFGLIAGAAVMGAVLAIQARRAEKLARLREQEAQQQRQEAEDNKNAWLEISDVYMKAAVEAEIGNASARIDADLLEYKTDSRAGLLRLARPLKDFVGPLPLNGPNSKGTFTEDFKNNPKFIKLREFQAAAVISAGQEFVPLVPPVLGLDSDETACDVSPDGRLCIVGVERAGLELFAVPSMARIGILREGAERVLQYGFSPDSKTIYTQDHDSIVRFWNTDGTLRARTPPRTERFIYPAEMDHHDVCQACTQVNPFLVADGIALLWSQPRTGVKPGKANWNNYGDYGTKGPADLYSTRTGKFIRRLVEPGQSVDWSLSPNSQWLIEKSESYDNGITKGQLTIISTRDGREIAKIDHDGPFRKSVSPSGKWILTYRTNEDEIVNPDQVRLWRTTDWTQVDDTALRDSLKNVNSLSTLRFITDDVVSIHTLPSTHIDERDIGLFQIGRPGSFRPSSNFCHEDEYLAYLAGELGGTLIRADRGLTDANTFQRLKPPFGRKYHPDLAKVAPDGRFFENLDTVTEKELPQAFSGTNFPDFGQVAVRVYYEPRTFADTELRILPDSKRLDFPSELLELWAQVVTGGELDAVGVFQPWDQPTWAARQHELAAKKPPYADFPFPGWAATEPHLWHRIRAYELPSPNQRDERIAEWRRLTGRARPDLERDTWRTPEIAPTSNEPNSP